jgi:DNA invertase Pin-like site-specific DNA recombinase
MRVALYARVSTERQERQGTIASQLDALHRFAREHDHAIVDAYVCVDDGYSGTRLDRPGLDRLRDGAEARAFDAVLILCPDRLARKYAYQVVILEELERFGVFVTFLEQPPGDDPHARLLTQIQGAIAEYERMKIAERYRRGKLFRARQGDVICWKVPYGYRRISFNGHGPSMSTTVGLVRVISNLNTISSEASSAAACATSPCRVTGCAGATARFIITITARATTSSAPVTPSGRVRNAIFGRKNWMPWSGRRCADT